MRGVSTAPTQLAPPVSALLLVAVPVIPVAVSVLPSSGMVGMAPFTIALLAKESVVSWKDTERVRA